MTTQYNTAAILYKKISGGSRNISPYNTFSNNQVYQVSDSLYGQTLQYSTALAVNAPELDSQQGFPGATNNLPLEPVIEGMGEMGETSIGNQASSVGFRDS